jgi:superfamily II DNA or RNA helicase
MLTLRPHQKDALAKLKDKNILWGGVGTGKTVVALAYYVKSRKSGTSPSRWL